MKPLQSSASRAHPAQQSPMNARDYVRLLDYGGVVVRLEDYDGVVPGGAGRIRALVELQAEHRRQVASRKPWRGFSMEAGIIVASSAMLAAALFRACQ